MYQPLLNQVFITVQTVTVIRKIIECTDNLPLRDTFKGVYVAHTKDPLVVVNRKVVDKGATGKNYKKIKLSTITAAHF